MIYSLQKHGKICSCILCVYIFRIRLYNYQTIT